MINECFSTKNAVAAELFSAAWCNLDCAYCYIPKGNQTLVDKHKEIIREVKEIWPLVNRLKKIFGTENLELLSHWGSEPSLTIKHFKEFYKVAIKEFPNLYGIKMSSNFLSNTDDIIDFILTFSNERKFEFDVQMSLDGPPWITDNNRRGGATQKIVENMINFISELNQVDTQHKISVHFKPTVSRNDYEKLLEDDNLLEYYKFFDKVLDDLIKANVKGNVLISRGCDMTVVCPDLYTTQDGINFNRIYEKTIQIRDKHKFKHVVPDSNYWFGFKKVALLGNEFFTKQKMFTCSAGDSQFGISEYLHPCHDTFYLPYPRIQEDILNDTDRLHSEHEEKDVKSGRLTKTKNLMTKKIENVNSDELKKYVYYMRGFHDFAQHKVGFAVAMIKEMAYAGQVSECYKNDDMAETLAIFSLSRHSCPTGQMQQVGSMNIQYHTYYRLFGNGLVENFVKRYLTE